MPFDSLTGAGVPGVVCPCAHRQRAVIQTAVFNTGESRIPTYKLAYQAIRFPAPPRAHSLLRFLRARFAFAFLRVLLRASAPPRQEVSPKPQALPTSVTLKLCSPHEDRRHPRP